MHRDDKPIVNCEFAHIRDELPPKDQNSDIGWRYWPSDDLTSEERNSFENLILLCSTCHKLIDKIAPRDYSAELLHQWKKKNEGDRGKPLAEIFLGLSDVRIENLLLESLDRTYQVREYMSREINELKGGDSFPLTTFPGQSIEFNKIHPSFSVIGKYTLREIHIEIILVTKNVRGSAWLNEFDFIHPGFNKYVWIERNYADSFFVDWETLIEIEVQTYARNGHFKQIARFGEIVSGEQRSIYPVYVTVERIEDDGSEKLLYKNEMGQLPDGQVYMTIDPVIHQ